MKKVLLILAAAALAVAVVMIVKIGPRNIIGMLRYDQRREGDLKVGDRAPDAQLVSLDGTTRQALFTRRDKPTVLIFGSFT